MTRKAPAEDPGDSRLRVGPPKDYAAGLPAVTSSLRHAHAQMGVRRSLLTLLSVNQKTGFDCPGCAWPEHRHRAEFCENGAKAVAEEATLRRVGPGFLRRAHPGGTRRTQRLLARPAGPPHPPHVPLRGQRPVPADLLGRRVRRHRPGTGRPRLTRPGRLLTLRSHDQYNTTIYGLDDRYRGIHQGPRVLFVHPDDLAERGLTEGDPVDIVSEFSDGIERRAPAFRTVAYPTPRGCCAAYFPETNVLVPLDSTAEVSNTPTSKSLVVLLEPAR